MESLEVEYMSRSSAKSMVSLPVPFEIAYILMYNAGTKEEGIHTTFQPTGNGEKEILFAFQALDDCASYADAIIESGTTADVMAEPVPTPVPLAQIQVACNDMGLILQVVPERQN